MLLYAVIADLFDWLATLNSINTFVTHDQTLLFSQFKLGMVGGDMMDGSMVDGSMVNGMVGSMSVVDNTVVTSMMDTMDKLSLFSVCGGDCSDKG